MTYDVEVFALNENLTFTWLYIKLNRYFVTYMHAIHPFNGFFQNNLGKPASVRLNQSGF